LLLTKNVIFKGSEIDKTIARLFKCTKILHSLEGSRPAIQALLYPERIKESAQAYPLGKELLSAESSGPVDRQVLVEVLLTLQLLDSLNLSRTKRRVMLDWLTIRVVQLVLKSSQQAAIDYLMDCPRRLISGSRALISSEGWRKRNYEGQVLLKELAELDQITRALQVLLKNYRLRIDRQARKDRNSNLNKWAKFERKNDEEKESKK
jgi:hypothetical protein